MGSYLVIGMGRFGSALATELYRLKQEVLAVDALEENVAGIANEVTDVLIGDAKDEAVLKTLGVHNFDCVVVAMAGDIEDSILATISLKELGAKKIVCKAHNERHAKILSMIGADKIIRPENDMGIRVATSLARQNFVDYLEISSDHGVLEMISPENWAGKSIAEGNLRRKYGVTVIAVRRADTQKIKFSPSADFVICKGDVLTLIGSREELDAVGALK